MKKELNQENFDILNRQINQLQTSNNRLENELRKVKETGGESGYQDLNQRNFRAMSEGLKSVRASNEHLEDELRKMREVGGEIQNKLNVLQQQYGTLLARFHGTGSTS